jgi:hypothetical protein
MQTANTLKDVLLGEERHAEPEFMKPIVMLFDNTYPNATSFDMVYKYSNDFGKWAFKWVKQMNGVRQEFKSEFIYDDIITAKNNCIVLQLHGQQGFWYYNTRTVFFYP